MHAASAGRPAGMGASVQAFKVPIAGSAVVLVVGLAAREIARDGAVLAAVAAAVLVVLWELRRQRARMEERFADVVADVSGIQPLLQLGARLRPRRPLPPLKGYAMF